MIMVSILIKKKKKAEVGVSEQVGAWSNEMAACHVAGSECFPLIGRRKFMFLFCPPAAEGVFTRATGS